MKLHCVQGAGCGPHGHVHLDVGGCRHALGERLQTTCPGIPDIFPRGQWMLRFQGYFRCNGKEYKSRL